MKHHSPISVVRYEHYDKDNKLIQKFSNSEAPQFSLKFVRKNKDGEIVQEHEQPFKSFTGNFAHLFNSLLFGVTNLGLIKTTANATNAANTLTAVVMAVATDDTYGIFAGDSGDSGGEIGIIRADMVQRDDYNLRGKIAHNAVALSYGATTVLAAAGTALSFKRSFVNNSASTITLREFGLVAKNAAGEYFMICRDVLENLAALTAFAIPVLAGDTLDVYYNFSAESMVAPSGRYGSFLDNYVYILKSILADEAVTVTKFVGTTASIDFNTNYAYLSCMAASADKTYGLVIGTKINPNLAVNKNMYALTLVTTDLDYSAHTAETLGTVDDLTVSIARPTIASTAASTITTGMISGTTIQVQRTFKNSGTVDILLNQVGLLNIGSGAGSRYAMIISNITNPGVSNFTLAAGESLKVILSLIYPHHLYV